MSRQCIDCPDTGLGVCFTYNPIQKRVYITGDAEQWEDCCADAQAVIDTQAWIRRAQALVGKRRVTVEEVEQALGIDLSELTW